MDRDVQVHRWQLRQASEAASIRESSKAEVEDVHALLLGPQDDLEPDASSQRVMAELGMENPLLLQGEPPQGASAVPAHGAQLRRSDSSRSTASRMSSRSPPPGRQAPRPILPTTTLPRPHTTVIPTDASSAGAWLGCCREFVLGRVACKCAVRMQAVGGGLCDE